MRLSVFLACLATGCASGYGKFYESVVSQGEYASRFKQHEFEPNVVSGYGNVDETILKMFERGYGLTGYASFNGPAEKTSKALRQGEKVGAAYVVVFSNYTDTASGELAISGSRQQTAYHSGTVRTYGSSGMSSGYYSGTSSTSVPTTTYIPYSVRRYDQTALYFAPLKKSCLGVMLRDASSSELRSAGTNKVVKVAAVWEGSAAYQADILPGDLLYTDGENGINPNEKSFGLSSGDQKILYIARGQQWYQVEVVPGNCE